MTPAWWTRTDRGPTSAELRAHALEQLTNSACRAGLHDRCPGTVYVGHTLGEPRHEPCACDCHHQRQLEAAA